MAPHPLEVADGVANGVNPHVAHMQLTRWVREHGEDVELLPRALKKNLSQSVPFSFGRISARFSMMIQTSITLFCRYFEDCFGTH